MKSLKRMLMFLAAGTLLVANQSCSKDDDLVAPTISVSSTKTTDITLGEVVTVTVDFKAGTDRKVKSLSSEIDNGTGTGYIAYKAFAGKTASDTTFSSDGSVVKIAYMMPANNVTLRFTVKDDKDQTASGSVALTAKTGSDATSYSAVLIGAQANASTGSFFSASNGTVYTISNAKDNSALIDFCYFYGATNKATLCAPSAPEVGTKSASAVVYSSTNDALNVYNWTTKNGTKFKKLATSDFDDAANASKLSKAYTDATSTEVDKANDLANNDVYGFKTAGGKFGMFKVTALTANNDGSITISVRAAK